METRRSARLRAKGRRRWASVEGDLDETIEEPSSTDLPAKRPRIEGLDDEEEEERDEDYVESDSEEDDKVANPSKSRSRSRSRNRSRTRTRRSPTRDKNWDKIYDEDDENHESETLQDFPSEIEVFGVDKYFVIDGYVYRKLPTERKCGLGGFYLRCRQDKTLNCYARATAVQREDGKFVGRLSKTANQHSHDPPPDGSFLVPVPNQSSGRRGRTSAKRRGRPPKFLPDDDDNETEDGEDDDPSRYKIPVEMYGMQKYFVMEGYVYRRHRDRRVGLRGVYLRCYQDKDLNCPARAVGVWFRKRSDVDSGERGDRLLFGRMSTRFHNHSHRKPPKGHFWLKLGQQQLMFLPPHLRKTVSAASEGSVEYADFVDMASETNQSEETSRDAWRNESSKRYSTKSPSDDHHYQAGRSVTLPRTSAEVALSVPQAAAETRKRQSGRPADTKATVPVVQSGAYYIIDGYAFKRQRLNQTRLICVEGNREAKCGATATLVQTEATVKLSQSSRMKAYFPNPNARKHTHGRPPRGQYFVPSSAGPAPVVVRTSTLSARGLPASSAMMLFTRTPFIRPLTVTPVQNDDQSKPVIRLQPRAVNLKAIMNSYRYCMDALIRLQDGYYIGRFPQLTRLIDAPGSELIEYFTQRSDSQLQMTAADERTKFILNHELKHYRAICDFMLLAPVDCERLLEAYRRWLTAAKARSWWNNGDLLEYVCRLTLRSDEFNEHYELALATSQQCTRLRYLFRPLLPLPEPKYFRCERETVRRWEMRQSLDSLNARITSVRLREGDSDAGINRLLDEFEGAVTSFRRFLTRYNAEKKEQNEEEESESGSDEDWQGEGSKKKGDKDSWENIEPPPVLTAATEDVVDREHPSTAEKLNTTRGSGRRAEEPQRKSTRAKQASRGTSHQKEGNEESDSEMYSF